MPIPGAPDDQQPDTTEDDEQKDETESKTEPSSGSQRRSPTSRSGGRVAGAPSGGTDSDPSGDNTSNGDPNAGSGAGGTSGVQDSPEKSQSTQSNPGGDTVENSPEQSPPAVKDETLEEVQSRYGNDVSRDDLRVEDGNLKFTDEFVENRRQSMREAADRIPGTGIGKTEVSNVRSQRADERADRRQAARDAVENTPGTGVGRDEFAQERDRQSSADSTNLADPTEKVNIPGVSGSNAQTRDEGPEEEQFGDIAVQNPITGNRVEDDLERVSGTLRNTARDAGNVVGQGQAFIRNTAAAAVGEEEFRGNEIIANPTAAPSQGNDAFLAGTVEGAASLVSAPVDVALGLKEGGELAAYTGEQVSSDIDVDVSSREISFSGENTGKTASRISKEAGATAETFKKTVESNPERFGGTLAGSLIGSAGIMGAAARVSPTAGRATRYAIQPGEEVISDTATRAFPGVASKFPNNRIDNEEIVISTASKATSKAAPAVRRAKYDFTESLSDFANANRAQADLTFGLESDSGSSETVEIADEPLGSSPDRGIDPAQQELDQAQYELGTFAEQEREVTQDQFRDFGRNAQERSVTRQERRRQDALDQLTFDPEAESRVEPELERQRQAERTFDDELGDRGMDWSQFGTESTVDSELGRKAAAESPETMSESELSQELKQRQRAAEASFGQQQEQARSVEQEVEFGSLDFGQEFDVGLETETRQDIEVGQELGTELGVESEQDVEQRQDLNQDIETMFENEAETESEFEFNSESEFELEAESQRGNRRQSRSGGMFGDAFERQFEREVGDPVDFVLGDSGSKSKKKKKRDEDDDLGLDFGGLFGV